MVDSMNGSAKPAVLIVGGLGYVGRFLALDIHQHELASEIRLVDKHLPELAFLAPEFKEACSGSKFMQADASREQNMAKIFDLPGGRQFDYVFNCGGETRWSQEDEVYKARSLTLSVTLATEAARRKIRCYVELSTGMVYKSDRSPSNESSKLKPWLKLAKWKLQAEENLNKIEGLNLVVLRMAHVYGPYTNKYIATALCLARVYQSLDEEMKWLWDRELRINTVHVEDVARALWSAAVWYDGNDTLKVKRPASVFNIVDQGDTSQGSLADILHQIFKIPMKFEGSLISQFARLHLDSVVDDLNDETLDPWADLQAEAGVNDTSPLSPFMEKELLKDNDLSMDGSLFQKEVGFEYKHPRLTKAEIESIIDSYRRMKWWP